MEDLIAYIIHYTPLKERKSFLLNEMSLHSLNYHFIEDFDREKLTDEDLIKFDKTKLRLGTISLFRKQIHAMKLIKNSSYNHNLVLEDDIILDKDFTSKLKNGLKQLPYDYDMLFIDDGPGLHIESSVIKSDKLIYKKCREPTRWGGNGGTRGMGAIIISKKCAKKICIYYENMKENEIKLPLDWWLNEVIRNLKLEIYWMEPTIVKQGSVTGKYTSSH